MASAATYTPIATTTLGSATGSYTFSSIPQTYTDLVVVAQATISVAAGSVVQFNGDTGNNYSYTYISGDGSSASSSRVTNNNYIQTGGFQSNGTNGAMITNILNYSNATTYKTLLSRENATFEVRAYVGLWRNTAAITSITLFPTSGTYSTGSTFTLYGIASA